VTKSEQKGVWDANMDWTTEEICGDGEDHEAAESGRRKTRFRSRK